MEFFFHCLDRIFPFWKTPNVYKQFQSDRIILLKWDQKKWNIPSAKYPKTTTWCSIKSHCCLLCRDCGPLLLSYSEFYLPFAGVTFSMSVLKIIENVNLHKRMSLYMNLSKLIFASHSTTRSPCTTDVTSFARL